MLSLVTINQRLECRRSWRTVLQIQCSAIVFAIMLWLSASSISLWVLWGMCWVFLSQMSLCHHPTLYLKGSRVEWHQQRYQIGARSKIGIGFCWLELTGHEHVQRLMLMSDMLPQPNYRQLCLLVQCRR
ncbi:protein YgfX [Celerinatantimonas sp. YJH-8]|uniref:protein YgfX n=1 Tax=Celerinatantimonas sp. YJH-8 TaxID=3228714 RepID=UPI0038BEDAD7